MSKRIDLEQSINLRKLRSEMITTKKGTRCIIIPLVENNLEEATKGEVYLNLKCWALKEPKEQNGFLNTHIVKQKHEKDVFDKMTKEQKEAMPILGNVSEFISKAGEPIQSETVTSEEVKEETDDLPF